MEGDFKGAKDNIWNKILAFNGRHKVKSIKGVLHSFVDNDPAKYYRDDV